MRRRASRRGNQPPENVACYTGRSHQPEPTAIGIAVLAINAVLYGLIIRNTRLTVQETKSPPQKN
jgi:hypothetical protein